MERGRVSKESWLDRREFLKYLVYLFASLFAKDESLSQEITREDIGNFIEKNSTIKTTKKYLKELVGLMKQTKSDWPESHSYGAGRITMDVAVNPDDQEEVVSKTVTLSLKDFSISLFYMNNEESVLEVYVSLESNQNFSHTRAVGVKINTHTGMIESFNVDESYVYEFAEKIGIPKDAIRIQEDMVYAKFDMNDKVLEQKARDFVNGCLFAFVTKA